MKYMPLAQRELVLDHPHLPLPVHDQGHRTVTFHPHLNHIHSPSNGGPPTVTGLTTQIYRSNTLTPCIAERSIGTGPLALFSEKSGGLIHTVYSNNTINPNTVRP